MIIGEQEDDVLLRPRRHFGERWWRRCRRNDSEARLQQSRQQLKRPLKKLLRRRQPPKRPLVLPLRRQQPLKRPLALLLRKNCGS